MNDFFPNDQRGKRKFFTPFCIVAA